MRYYIEICDELAEQAPDITQHRYTLFDKQFDNLWADQGLTLLNRILELLGDDAVAQCVTVRTDQGDEVDMETLHAVLDGNNVIWDGDT